MKCPYCNREMRSLADTCPHCGRKVRVQTLPEEEIAHITESTAMRPSHVASAVWRFAVILFSICFFIFVAYTAYFWFDSWRTDRIYTNPGMRAPDVEEITMSDGRVGHSITFYGKDGDQLFIPQLNKSYMFVGGMTQIDIADSSWFDASPEEDEAAIVTLMPIIYTEGNGRTQLPELQFTVATPESPFTMINPRTTRTDVNTSVFQLRFQVVPGSKVYVNSQDLTDMVNFEGILDANINVDPIGENLITVNVRTPNHKQIRKEIIFDRPPQSINLEPDLSLTKSTTKSTVDISGTAESGAQIVVDSKYVDGSIKVKENGAFSFKAKLTTIGDNVITFHATKEGRDDTYLSVTVYYVPPLEQYDKTTWVMDYKEVVMMGDIWAGKKFLCKGPVLEVFYDEDEPEIQWVAMDVAPADAEEQQIVILQNRTSIKEPEVGTRYKAYADVQEGTKFYADKNCPVMVARYMSVMN